MKLIFIRHGEPNYETGCLTKQGVLEAEALTKVIDNMKIDNIYVSPLLRAEQTCSIAIKNTNHKPITLPYLEEFVHKMDVPYKSDKMITWDLPPRFLTTQKDLYNYDTFLDNKYLKTGDIKAHYNNVINSFDNLLKEHGYNRVDYYYEVINENEKTLVFFCHFGVICVILSHLLNLPYVILTHAFCALPSSITEVVTEEREKGIAQFRCIRFGDLSHLKLANIKESFHARFCETFSSKDRH